MTHALPAWKLVVGLALAGGVYLLLLAGLAHLIWAAWVRLLVLVAGTEVLPLDATPDVPEQRQPVPAELRDAEQVA